jgi:hypothetical protein
MFINALNLIRNAFNFIYLLITGIFNKLGEDNGIKSFGSIFASALNNIFGLISKVFIGISDIFTTLGKNGSLNSFENIFVNVLETIITLFSGLGKTIGSNQSLWGILKQAATYAISIILKTLSYLSELLKWIGSVGVPIIINAFLDLLSPIARVIQTMGNLGLIVPIIMGVVSALLYCKLATLALAAAQKVGLIINALIKAWSFATGILELLSKGISIAAIAQDLFNAAMLANPIGVIAVVIGVVIGLLALLATHWKQVKSFAMDCINWIIDGLNKVIGLLNKIPGVKIGLISKVGDNDNSGDNPKPSDDPTNNTPSNSPGGVSSYMPDTPNNSAYTSPIGSAGLENNPWLAGTSSTANDPWSNNNQATINPSAGTNSQMPFMPGSPAFGTNPMSYMMPQSNTITNHVTNTLSQTTHIYGTNDAAGTANNIQDGAQDLLRSMQGVFI